MEEHKDPVESRPEVKGQGVTILLKPGTVDIAAVNLVGNPNTAQIAFLAQFLSAWADLRLQEEIKGMLERHNQQALVAVRNGRGMILPPVLGS